MTKLALLRHGESIWNKENRFTGWTDVDLSEKGIKDDLHHHIKFCANDDVSIDCRSFNDPLLFHRRPWRSNAKSWLAGFPLPNKLPFRSRPL